MPIESDFPENSAILKGPLILLVLACPVNNSKIILNVNIEKSYVKTIDL